MDFESLGRRCTSRKQHVETKHGVRRLKPALFLNLPTGELRSSLHIDIRLLSTMPKCATNCDDSFVAFIRGCGGGVQAHAAPAVQRLPAYWHATRIRPPGYETAILASLQRLGCLRRKNILRFNLASVD